LPRNACPRLLRLPRFAGARGRMGSRSAQWVSVPLGEPVDSSGRWCRLGKTLAVSYTCPPERFQYGLNIITNVGPSFSEQAASAALQADTRGSFHRLALSTAGICFFMGQVERVIRSSQRDLEKKPSMRGKRLKISRADTVSLFRSIGRRVLSDANASRLRWKF